YPVYFFFFSSRRRHTRSKRDWSSDVCSSDLSTLFVAAFPDRKSGRSHVLASPEEEKALATSRLCLQRVVAACPESTLPVPTKIKIGRASCREREKKSRVDVGLREKGRMVR